MGDRGKSGGSINQIHTSWKEGFGLAKSFSVVESTCRGSCWLEHDFVGDPEISDHGVVEHCPVLKEENTFKDTVNAEPMNIDKIEFDK